MQHFNFTIIRFDIDHNLSLNLGQTKRKILLGGKGFTPINSRL